MWQLLLGNVLLPAVVCAGQGAREDFGQVYDRNKLKEFIAAQGLEKTEANIILGALSCRIKTISEVMRNLGEVQVVYDTDTLDNALKLFLSNRIHLAIVKHHVARKKGNDKDAVTVGLVTLERHSGGDHPGGDRGRETDIPEVPQVNKALQGRRKFWKDVSLSGTSASQIPGQLRLAAAQNLAMQYSELFGRTERNFGAASWIECLRRKSSLTETEEPETLCTAGTSPPTTVPSLLEGRAVLGIGVENLELRGHHRLPYSAAKLSAVESICLIQLYLPYPHPVYIYALCNSSVHLPPTLHPGPVNCPFAIIYPAAIN
uniref:Annexin n=1 Tax=Macrostomum lignano TaxID=282301 RepID=A0A1I8FKN4_9PLAT